MTNILIEELNSEKRIKMLLMSHKSRWGNIEYLESKYNNFIIDTIGITTLELTDENKHNDYDIIIYYTSLEYRKYEYEEIKKLARHISEEKDKRVTIGYKYYVPEIDKEQVMIFSVINEEEFEIVKNIDDITEVLHLVDLTLKTANDLDRVKKKILEI